MAFWEMPAAMTNSTCCDWRAWEELKQPGTQMFLIAAAAAAVAGGCFYVARLLASNEED